MPLTEKEGELKFHWEPACSDLYNWFQMCRTARQQIKFYHRYGHLDDCRRFSQEWTTCMRTKLLNPDEAQELYDKYQAEKQAKAPKPIWEPRTTPPNLFR